MDSHTMKNNRVRTGDDPRALAEFSALRDEIAKLSHPARPDVNWGRAEQLCLTLFRQNGVELQTAAWYTLTRARRAGLPGICEGLEVIDGLVTHQWSTFWPQQTHVRVDIFAWLTAHLQQVLRTCLFSYQDLPLIYRTEQVLEHLCDVLQRLELKHLSKLDSLRLVMQSSAQRLETLEQSRAPGPGSPPADRFANTAATSGPQIGDSIAHNSATPPPHFNNTYTPETAGPSLLYVVHENAPLDQPRIQLANHQQPPRYSAWHGLLAGIALSVLIAASTWGVYRWLAPSAPELALRQATAPLPQLLEPEQLAELRQLSHKRTLEQRQEETVKAAQTQLTHLGNLSPVWDRIYGDQLLNQLRALWPLDSTIQELAKQWHSTRESTALPLAELEYHHQAKARLQQLARQLDGVDEKRRRYLTVSELKSAVFAIRQQLQQSTPLEELLRQLAEQQKSGTSSPILHQQIETRINQLLNRYALLQGKERE